jgi:hypothetical protein
MGWSLVSAIHEFEQYCETEGGLVDMQFIENYNPDGEVLDD